MSWNPELSDSWSKILGSTTTGFAVKDFSGNLLEVNPAFCRMLGYSREELVGMSHSLVTHPHDLPNTRDTLEQLAAGKSHEISGVVRYLTKSVQPLICRQKLSLLSRDGAGQVLLQLEVAAEKGFKELYEVQSVLDAAFDFALIATDRNGTVRQFNRGAEILLGYDAREVVGRKDLTLFHDSDELRARELELSSEHGTPVLGFDVLVQQARKGNSERHTWNYCAKQGLRIPVSVVVTPIVGNEETAGFLFVARNIASELESRQRILESVEAAEAASHAKSTFLTNMSHEIRTPMNGVLGITQLLRETSLDLLQKDYVGMIHTAGDSLLQIIDDILDFSKIEAGKMTLSMASFDPEELLRAVSGLLGPKADEKGLTLTVKADFTLPSWVWGDSLRLQQVLFNLVGNAVKFTSRGVVRLDVSQIKAPGATPTWEFRVTDTGVGLMPDQISRLFQPFEQAETYTTRQFGGTGLGLSICKRLVELMGGELGVESRSGKGSSFWFRVPIEEPRETAPKPLSSSTPAGDRLDGYRILLVEDAPINQVVAGTMLRNAGAEVELANDGSQCLEMLKNNPDKFDVILMDVQMPVMNGFEATLIIRNDLELRIPIIALTAGVMDEEREKCLAIGMNGLIPKPIEKAVLLRLLRSLVLP